MAAQLLSIVLILAGFTGIHSITTVSKVSVKAGGSISIPCLYHPDYRDHIKYLCEGQAWNSCSYAVKTKQTSTSEDFLISDDTKRNIFTVTINNLMESDAHFWCAVEIVAEADDKEYFHLSVSRGTPSLYVDQQEKTGFEGGSVTVSCRSTSAAQMKWCRLGGSCVDQQSGSMDGTPVTISGRVGDVFKVTMSELRLDSSGWYWCAQGDLQMPVHLTVYEQESTTAGTTTRLTANTEAGTAEEGQQSDNKHLKILFIRLSLLIFIVMVSLFIWWMFKRRKQTEVINSSAVTVAAPTDESAIYCNVAEHKT